MRKHSTWLPKMIYSAFFLFLLSGIMPKFAFGACPGIPGAPPVFSGSGILPGPNSQSEDALCYTQEKFFPSLTSTFVTYVLAIAVGMIIIGGLAYLVSSGGDLIGKAKDIIIWAIVGSAIAMLAYTIVKLVVGLDFYGSGNSSDAFISTPTTTQLERPITGVPLPLTPPMGRSLCKDAPSNVPLSQTNIPDSCYTGTDFGTPSLRDCKEGDILAQICIDMGLSDCRMTNIQRQLLSRGYYFDPNTGQSLPSDCSQIDGVYGQCTQIALQNYYDSQC